MEIIQLILLVLCASSVAIGTRMIAEPGKILNPVYESMVKWVAKAQTPAGKYAREMVTKPVLTCSTCMASVWGSGIFTLLSSTLLGWGALKILLLVAPACLSCAFVITILWSHYGKIELERRNWELRNRQLDSQLLFSSLPPA